MNQYINHESISFPPFTLLGINWYTELQEKAHRFRGDFLKMKNFYWASRTVHHLIQPRTQWYSVLWGVPKEQNTVRSVRIIRFILSFTYIGLTKIWQQNMEIDLGVSPILRILGIAENKELCIWMGFKQEMESLVQSEGWRDREGREVGAWKRGVPWTRRDGQANAK